ncbi:phenylalanyl-tRNA synthetase alpha subunit, mitochondrial [Zygosaccharomyces mellis]|uniref:Phenylalanine--tRNA ligase, mitochondrial n=1 Tax=Zygosaccharomyces mellis TaxID=42258 RepID=A0A4C2E4E9_9SACH|nr:phenylalanyl-tRNA synthetase alpha subunit, mitochondrial [Zygosaccharomyces mellis]
MLKCSTFANALKGSLRLYSVASAPLNICGKRYATDENITNVTQSIVDLTGRGLHLKDSHPVGILRDAIETKLNSTDGAFKCYNEFQPVVSIYENFDSLGFPSDHPGRSKSDTYYINGEQLLRTHTSAHEMECFAHIQNGESKQSGFLISADVYRRDEIDRTHYPVFHQMEGCRLWMRNSRGDHIKQIQDDLSKLQSQLSQQKTKIIVQDDSSLEGNPKQAYMSHNEFELCSQHLKRSIELVVAEVFERKLESMRREKDLEIPSELKCRWIKAYFPWTAPSWEIEVWWQDDWLELCGCGLVQQEVLKNAGFPAESTISWAFGLGLDRIAMLLFEIPDIRLFWTQDERFHSQFQKGVISTFKPYSKYPGSTRDIAFWLPSDKDFKNIHTNDVMEIIRTTAGDLVENVKLIDQFTHPKKLKKSLCYRINYQSMDRNITNSEVNEIHNEVAKQLIETFDVEVR